MKIKIFILGWLLISVVNDLSLQMALRHRFASVSFGWRKDKR